MQDADVNKPSVFDVIALPPYMTPLPSVLSMFGCQKYYLAVISAAITENPCLCLFWIGSAYASHVLGVCSRERRNFKQTRMKRCKPLRI